MPKAQRCFFNHPNEKHIPISYNILLDDVDLMCIFVGNEGQNIESSIPNYHDDYSFIDDSSVVVVGVIGRPEGGVAYSVEILKIENNNVIYKDNQNDGQWRYCYITD